MRKVHSKIISIVGNVITVKATGVFYEELAQINTARGKSLAQVIKLDNDQVSLQVFSGSRGVSTSDEVRLARALANQVAVALEKAQYLKQTQETLEETTALYQVASALSSTQDSHTIMSTVLREYLHVLNLKQGSVIIFNFEEI